MLIFILSPFTNGGREGGREGQEGGRGERGRGGRERERRGEGGRGEGEGEGNSLDLYCELYQSESISLVSSSLCVIHVVLLLINVIFSSSGLCREVNGCLFRIMLGSVSL